ncbi:hypothetical protein A2V82_07300 [candidate division KSB1 bacterium RBG_16_48_16]|nr:MAG: hypothetical protein A2V82_07300 [candidate division KSB1 bacterium RBG_16_48_16]
MRNIISILFIVFANALFSQETPAQDIGLTQLTLEQKLDRSVMNSVSYLSMGLSFAKSMGKTAEEYGEYCAGLAIPAYQFLIGRSPIEVINVIYGVQQTDKNFEIQIDESSGSSLTGRMSLFGLSYIRLSDGFGGVTEADFYTFYNTFFKKFVESVGFAYEYEVKEDWIVFTINKND